MLKRTLVFIQWFIFIYPPEYENSCSQENKIFGNIQELFPHNVEIRKLRNLPAKVMKYVNLVIKTSGNPNYKKVKKM